MAQPAVTAGTPPVNAQHQPAPHLQLKTIAIKQETGLPTTRATNSQSSELLSLQSSEEPQSPPPVPHFLNSIKELRDLSDALAAFHRCYEDLQAHLDSIKTAIESKLSLQLSNVSVPASTENLNGETSTAITQSLPNETPLDPSEDDDKGDDKMKENSMTANQSEVESFCVTMCSRSLRKYILTNLGELSRLREEVPRALKRAPNPAKLVLECSGRFFLQGSRAYAPGSHMIPAREASVFVLECFLLMGDEDGVGTQVTIEKAMKQETEQAAVAWRKRLISEGGLARASEIDARGLLFFLGCFGVPQVFRYEDFRDLARAGNVKEISAVLKRSRLLMTKIREVIEGMVKNKMAVDAADLAYTFGLEDKFTTHTMLTSFLRSSKDSWKKEKRESQGSLVSSNEANKKHLVALISVVKCLERHNLDPSKILSGWQISSKILRLEKEISEVDKNIRERTAKKRKADEADSSKKLKIHELQHTYYTSKGPQLASTRVDSHRNLLDRIPSHPSGAGLLPENISDSVTGLGGGMLRAGVGSSISVGAAGHLSRESYPGVYGGVFVDAARQAINYTSSQPYGLHGDAAYHEPLVPYTGQASSLGLTNLYKSSASLEGLSSSSIGISHRGSGPDLYHFADNVESESYYSQAFNRVGVTPSSAPFHHSSRLC